MVDAAEARAHILALARRGVGRRSVAAAADLNVSTLYKIRSGERGKIRLATARAILAVDEDSRADKSLVSAERAWRILRALLRRGYSKTQLAAWMGSKARVPSIQLRAEWITARNAAKVEKLWRMVNAGRLQRPGGAAADLGETKSWGLGIKAA
jgi:hypothetical protein